MHNEAANTLLLVFADFFKPLRKLGTDHSFCYEPGLSGIPDPTLLPKAFSVSALNRSNKLMGDTLFCSRKPSLVVFRKLLNDESSQHVN